MAYAVIEFSNGELSVVSEKWLTPEKSQVYWPPYKDSYQYKKALKRQEEANETSWSLYPINKCFYETDNLEKAFKKQKLAELTSNLETDEPDDTAYPRKKKKPRRYSSSEEEEFQNSRQKIKLPPKITFNGLSSTSQHQGQLIQEKRRKDEQISTQNIEITETGCMTNLQIVENTHAKKEDVNILPHLIKIREQNNQILAILRSINNQRVVNYDNDKLPLDSLEDLENFETELLEDETKASLVSYLSSLGGDGVVTRTNRILKEVLTNNLASQFNFLGQNKKPFKSLRLKNIIVDTVKGAHKTATTVEVEQAIKNWLKHAPQRIKLAKLKLEKNCNQ